MDGGEVEGNVGNGIGVWSYCVICWFEVKYGVGIGWGCKISSDDSGSDVIG